MELNKMYNLRFNKETKFRNKLWAILCTKFFQKYINKNSVVLDVAAGHCEFINNIQAKEKIALDLNKDVKKLANKNVRVLIEDASFIKSLKNSSVDVVFISNFFEHITKEDITKVIKEVRRILKNKGKLLILQPNIRFCYKEYWNFFDHITPLDDKSMAEILLLNDFDIIKLFPKFLPFTTKTKIRGILPDFLILLFLKIVLKIRFIQNLVGGQMFIYAINKKK